MMIYRRAFERHDRVRYEKFIGRAVTGEEKIHAATLYPYDIVEKVLSTGSIFGRYTVAENPALEAQWRHLPDYVEPGTNALVIADTSGSMHGRPLATSVGLAVYFAERNHGEFHNMFMSFSGSSRIQVLRGETLAQKINSINMNDWENNTNLEAAFKHILDIAIRGHVSPEDMPKSLIVISDMEIDYCGDRQWTFYEMMEKAFRRYGYPPRCVPRGQEAQGCPAGERPVRFCVPPGNADGRYESGRGYGKDHQLRTLRGYYGGENRLIIL